AFRSRMDLPNDKWRVRILSDRTELAPRRSCSVRPGLPTRWRRSSAKQSDHGVKTLFLFTHSPKGLLMAGGFEHAAIQFLHAYGYIALFALLALETAMILHFVPSEVIVTVAAATLATDGTRLALVIVVSTLGATAGSLALYAFARYGGRRFLDRHPRFFGLTEQRRARLDGWFRRPAGESLVFFLRMLPFVRAAVSIPAGLAEMEVGRFTLYSAAGSLVFNAVLAYSAYAVRANPDALAEIRQVIAYSTSRWPFFLALACIALAAVYLLYRRRRAYLGAPDVAVRHVLRTSAIAAIIAGLILLGLSLYAPRSTYAAVTWIAVDAGRLAEQYNVSALLFLLSIALGAITLGLFILSFLPFLERVTKAIFSRMKKHESKGPP
ncbi:MAG: DedA family protein, partial [Burkholderiaceae bacterium]